MAILSDNTIIGKYKPLLNDEALQQVVTDMKIKGNVNDYGVLANVFSKFINDIDLAKNNSNAKTVNNKEALTSLSAKLNYGTNFNVKGYGIGVVSSSDNAPNTTTSQWGIMNLPVASSHMSAIMQLAWPTYKHASVSIYRRYYDGNQWSSWNSL